MWGDGSGVFAGVIIDSRIRFPFSFKRDGMGDCRPFAQDPQSLCLILLLIL